MYYFMKYIGYLKIIRKILHCARGHCLLVFCLNKDIIVYNKKYIIDLPISYSSLSLTTLRRM